MPVVKTIQSERKSIFLDEVEIRDFCDSALKRVQMSVLSENKIPFRIVRGNVKVLRSSFYNRMDPQLFPAETDNHDEFIVTPPNS